jgi:hypothetical protein
MITCPWCGTSYPSFLSNCKNCGGPIPPPASGPAPAAARQDPGDPPPAAPRPIADNYAWKLLWTDGLFIVGFVFLILGGSFALTGIILTITVVAAFIGLPFAALGIAMLAGGAALGYGSYQQKLGIVNVLRNGSAVRGQITGLDQNLNISVNNAHPWTIDYAFDVAGQMYTGRVVTLKTPGPALQPGQPVWVLHLPDEPQKNAIYPHP